MTSSRYMRSSICLLITLTVWLTTPQMSQAQFVVSDPTNLVQNTTSAISEVTSAYQQIQSVALQTKQLANQIQNLRKLELQNWRDFIQAFNQVSYMLERTKIVAARWGVLALNFDEIYGKYGPSEVDGETFWTKRRLWEKETNDAFEHNTKKQAEVAEANATNHDRLKDLEEEAEDVDGQLAATEHNGKTLQVIGNQQATLIDLELARSKAEQAKELEERRKAEAAHARQMEALSRGFSTPQYADPVILKDF